MTPIKGKSIMIRDNKTLIRVGNYGIYSIKSIKDNQITKKIIITSTNNKKLRKGWHSK